MAAAVTATGRPAGGPRRGAGIRLEGLSINLGTTEVVAGIDLVVQPGEFVCLLGPSGCGKSTVLNAVAGFVAPAAGRVRVGDSTVDGPSVDRGVVFQSSESLFPWLNVRENVEYGPRMRGMPRADRRALAARYLRMVGLEHATERFPGELSGGMCQRAQIARVLVNEPTVVLMDEPFGALDAQTRRVMQSELDRLWRETGCTVLFITHDIGEAVLLGDRVVTMTAGPRARIKTVRQVALAHPRDLTDAGAVELFRVLRDDIAEEVVKSMRI